MPLTYKIGDKIVIEDGKEKHGLAPTPFKDNDDPDKIHFQRWKHKVLDWDNDTKSWKDNGSTYIFNKSGDAAGKYQLAGAVGYYQNADAAPLGATAGTQDWGAETISKDDFVNSDGTPRSLIEIAQRLDPKLPNKTGDELLNEIRDLAPKYTGVPLEEKQFLAEERGFAERAAGMAKDADMYGLQKEARKVGAQMRGAYGGMGASMRAGIEGAGDVAKGAEVAGDKYGLAKDKAEFAERKGMYGLTKSAEEAYEGELEGFIDKSWFTTPDAGSSTTDWSGYEGALTPEELATQGREGGYVHKDRSGIGNNRRFNSETFLDVLTNLPDAGGS